MIDRPAKEAEANSDGELRNAGGGHLNGEWGMGIGKGRSPRRAARQSSPDDTRNMTHENARPAVVLLSGGLDSATSAAIAQADGYEVYALSIDYGQRHRFELEAASRVAQALHVAEHKVLQIDLAALGGSALTADIDVPRGRSDDQIAAGIPITYVPARNTVMLSLALGYAEVLGAADIFIGVNAVDYSGYPDCRPAFIAAFERVANLATKAGVERALDFRIHTPLIDFTKAEIIRRGSALGVEYAMTHTCYAPNSQGISCGACDACRLRQKGFAEAGLVDPIEYQPRTNN
jgi:7-cyano-7-deazaguanine synthase